MISNWSNIVARRDLIRTLTRSELQSQRTQTRFGWLWWLIDPLIMMLIYWAIVVGIFGRGARYEPYPIFIACALIPWKHFAGATAGSATVLRARAALVKSIAFPTIVLPISTVLAGFAHFLFAFGVLLAGAALMGRPLGAALLQLPALMLMQLLVVLGLGLAAAGLGALIQDLSSFLTHLLRVGFYLTPTLFGLDLVKERLAAITHPLLEPISGHLLTIYMLNPFAVLITGYRDAVFHGRALEPHYWLLLAVQAGLLLVVGYRVYQYLDRRVIKFL